MAKTNHPINLSEVLDLYFAKLDAECAPRLAQSIQNETRSAIFRFVAPKLGLKRNPDSRRMSKADIQQAETILAQTPTRWLPKLMLFAEESFREQETPKAVQQTYGARLQQFVSSCESEVWYPGSRLKRQTFADECAPPVPRQFGRTHDDLLVPEKKGLDRTPYSLKPEQIAPLLQGELDEFRRFISDRYYLDRVIAPIEPEQANDYVASCLRFLGWWKNFRDPSIPFDDLSLNLLVPKVTDTELEDLSPKARQHRWRKINRDLKGWIFEYFRFLENHAKSYSPRTRDNNLARILKIAYFQYASEVEERSEYDQIPIFSAIRGLQQTYRSQIKEWENNRRYVANQSKKWPDVPDGKTALTVLREGLFEKLRLRCRPRNSSGVLHKPRPQAHFFSTFLMWTEMLLEPPRRQEELRSRRLAMACPVERPATVPADGLYHPLPPDEHRKRNRDGLIVDNYLYRTYEYGGKHYPEGVWIKQVRKYKTHKHYGPLNIILQDQPLGDGLTLYDYLEWYLYGYFYVGNFKDSITYEWWDTALQRRRGKWLTKGVMEFESEVHWVTNEAEDWPWMLMFSIPRTGKPYSSDRLADEFDRSSHQWIGKRITPHVLRRVWATWSAQVGLTDAEFHALAYAMGSTYNALKRWYERSTPEDKRRPIEEAIDSYFHDVLGQYGGDDLSDASPQLKQILRSVKKLTTAERLLLESLLKAG